MRLEDALAQIAQDAGLNANELVGYAREDNLGGRDTGAFDNMSTFADEGRFIYALVRALKPQTCVEIGVASGGTSTHILTALERNGSGYLYSYDIQPGTGYQIPEHLKGRWSLTVGDALSEPLPASADFCFEDGDHSYEFTASMLVRLRTLNPRIIISHDALTHEVYGDAFQVGPAFRAVLGGQVVGIDGAFTGLAWWVNPDWATVPAGILYAESVGQKLISQPPDYAEQPTISVNEDGQEVVKVHDRAQAAKPLARKARRKAAK